MLDIRLLGSPLIYLDGELKTIRRRAARALLFYLASHGKPVGRAQLGDLFWPEETEKKQRSQLRDILSKLREALPEIEFIQTHHETITLDFDLVSVDVREFNKLFESASNSLKISLKGQLLPAHIYEEFVRAVELWHGTVFIHSRDMSGSAPLERWWVQESYGLEQRYIYTLKILSKHENLIGAHENALKWLWTAYKIDDTDEDIHYDFLTSLLKTGQLGKVRLYYERIKEKFGAVPSDRILALEPLIYSKEGISTAHARPEWPIKPSVQAPFVGQENAIQSLRASYINRKATLVLGEAGAGKTRLVQEFYENLKIAPRLLLLPCHPANENIPYQPWKEMLRRDVEEHLWQKLPSVWFEPLTMLLPELHKGDDTLARDLSKSYAKPITFEAIKNILRLLSKEKPCLLFVDDAQWADEATLDLLEYLLKQSFFEQKNLRLVITARVEEKNLRLEQLMLNTLARRMEILKVLRLNEKDISELAFHILNEEPSPEISAHLLRETGGNPYFLLEFLLAIWALPERKKLNADFPVPANIKRLIERKLKNLSRLAKNVLMLAAVQGNPFQISLLEKTADLSLEEMTRVIDELENAQIIRPERKTKELKYAFVHEIIREEVISSLTPMQSRALHKKVAQALEIFSKKRQGSQAAILAKHYEKAGEFSLAFNSWVQAGRYAYHLFSVSDAHASFMCAQDLIAEASLEDEEIYELYGTWGSVLFRNDNVNLLEEIMEKLLIIAEERGSSLLKGVALDGMSDVCMMRNQFEKGLEYTEEALALINTNGHTPAMMNVRIHHGVFLYMLNKFSESQKSFLEAIDLGEEEKDPNTLYFLGTANYQMAAILTGMGRPAKALVYAKQSLQKMRLSHFSHGAILSYSIMGLANYYLANYEEGKKSALKSIDLASQSYSWRMLGYSSAYAGMNETELASLSAAWNHAQKAIEIGTKHEHAEIIAMGYKVLGDIYTCLDALPQAADAYQHGVDVDKGSFAMLANLARLGVTLDLLGDPKGDAMLQQALNYTQKANLETIYWNAKALELSLFIFRGDYRTFEKNLYMVRKQLVERSHPNSFVWTDHLQVLSLFYRGETKEALTRIELLLPILENSPFFWIRFRTLTLHIKILHTLNRESDAPLAQLEEMLEKIKNSLGSIPIQEEWQAFSKKHIS